MIIQGNKRLLDSRLAVILNSSQSKTPCGHDNWITNSASAIANLTKSKHTLVTSTGLNTWELLIHLAAINGGNQVIISPEYDEKEGRNIFEKTLADFDLDPEKASMVFVKPDSKKSKPKGNWLNRDRAALEIAQKIVSISIRPGGKMQKLIKEYESSKEIDTRWQAPYEKPIHKAPKYDKCQCREDWGNWDYVVHWTKTCHGPWPNQKSSEYYQSLINSGSNYPNNARNTLINIINCGKILASARHIREKRNVIGLSEVQPAQLIKDIRWSPKDTNYNFEPYGIGISKSKAIELGIRPVIYGQADDYKAMSDADKPYFQNRGEKNVDWSYEKEWRHPGDMDLTKLSPEQLIYVVWNSEDEQLLRNHALFEVIPISKKSSK